jgi:hypothetical protein
MNPRYPLFHVLPSARWRWPVKPPRIDDLFPHSLGKPILEWF